MVAFGVRCALMEGEQGAGGGLRARRGSRPAAQGPRRSLETDGDDDDDAGVGDSAVQARGSAPVTVGGGNGPPATTRVRQEAESSAVFGFTRPPALELKQQQ
ncbi:unnamed protein product [Lampetra planeri]